MKNGINYQQAIINAIKEGRTISQYPTGNIYGYGEYYRFDDTKEVVKSKTVWALKKKGLLPQALEIKSEIIK